MNLNRIKRRIRYRLAVLPCTMKRKLALLFLGGVP